jgi:hypothetical protein
MAKEELYQPTFSVAIKKTEAEKEKEEENKRKEESAVGAYTNDLGEMAGQLGLKPLADALQGPKSSENLIIKPALPSESFDKATFNQTIKDIEAAAKLGDVPKVVELSRNLYDYENIRDVNMISTNKPDFSTTAANIMFVEKQKQIAVKAYEKNTGKQFIPANEEQMYLTDTDLTKSFQTDNEGNVISYSLDKYKDLHSSGYKLLTTQGATFIPLDNTGKYVSSQEEYDRWLNGDDNVKTYTRNEVLDTQERIFEATGEVPDAYKNEVTVEAREGLFYVNGVAYNTREEAIAEADIQNAMVDGYNTGDFSQAKNMLPESVTEDIDATISAEMLALKDSARNSITTYASLMDDKVDETELNNWLEEIGKGTNTADQVLSIIKERSKIKYGAWSEQIDKGLTINDIAKNYVQTMAQTLELDPTSISLNDPTIQKALTTVNDNGQVSYKPLWQFERELKNDERYYQTNKSHNDMAGLAAAIAKNFGMI